MAKNKPVSLRIRTYQMGFGDCFLLTFKYDNYDRNMLIDFGSFRKPKWAGKHHMHDVALNIKKCCNGKLDAVVATHRHKDHIGGFATSSNKKSPGKVIASLNPKYVIQPWTEHPNAEETALEAPSKSFVKQLKYMNQYSSNTLKDKSIFKIKKLQSRFEFLGKNNAKNINAVRNLMQMGQKNIYANEGISLGIGHTFRGIKVHVLGPPTLKQSRKIEKQVSKHEQFWSLHSKGSFQKNQKKLLFEDRFIQKEFRYDQKWFINKIDNINSNTHFELVTQLDKQMNNTSLILLIEVGDKLLLFPGDAQIENWQHALSKPKYVKMLKKVDLYKVGHHGSLNATPKDDLWGLFEKKGTSNQSSFTTLLSTMKGVHGHGANKVPKNTLVDELSSKSNFISTENFGENKLFKDILMEFEL